MVAAAIRTIFAQPDAAAVADQLDSIAEKLGRQFPAVAQMLPRRRRRHLRVHRVPQAHWRKIWSTNPLERVNKEIKRRTNVVGIFPNEAGVFRLAGRVLLEVHDEWASHRPPLPLRGSMAKLYENDNTEPTPRRWDREPTNCSPANEQQHQRRRSQRRSHFPPLQGPRPSRSGH